MTAESCSLASRSVTKAIVGFSSIVLLEFNTVDPSKGFSARILKQIACSRRSDSGARAKKNGKKRGETGEDDEGFPRPLPQSPLVFSRFFARFLFRSRSTIWTPGTGYKADIIETHTKLLRYIPCDVHWKGQISRVMQIWSAFDQTTFTILSLTLNFNVNFIYYFNFNRRIKRWEKVWFVLPQFIWGRSTVCKLCSLN